MRQRADRVVTDLLVFRRRDADDELAAGTPTWEQTRLVGIDGHEIRVNGWFVDHPELVCGRLGVGRGQYQDADFTVRPDRPAAELLREALQRCRGGGGPHRGPPGPSSPPRSSTCRAGTAQGAVLFPGLRAFDTSDAYTARYGPLNSRGAAAGSSTRRTATRTSAWR